MAQFYFSIHSVCLFAQNTYVSFGGLKMSLQMVFKCPAKLYTFKIFTHNRIREHPKGCSFSLARITICIVTQTTYIFECGEFTEFVRHGCGQKLFKVTRVTVTLALWADLCPPCFRRQVTRAASRKRRTGQRGAGVSTSAGVYHNPRRTTEQSSSNPVDMLFALFVFCSFCVRFGNRFESLQMRWILCLFVLFGEKMRYPLTSRKMWSERFLNVVKFYTLGFLLPIIYIGALERVLFFHQCAAQGPCDRRTDRIR